jgi:hypothetical protein
LKKIIRSHAAFEKEYNSDLTENYLLFSCPDYVGLRNAGTFALLKFEIKNSFF